MGDHSVIFRLRQCEGKWRRVSETGFHVARILVVHLLILAAGDRIDAPLHQRKAELKKIIAGTDIQFSESFEIDGQAMFAHACKLGLEGVVSKVRDSVYPTGRSNDWVKKTCAQRETLTIASFSLHGSKWDALYVGRRKCDDLVYAGKVDHGFDKVSAAELRKRLAPLVRKTQAFVKRVAHKGIWVEPKLFAEIEYRAKSAEGKVRHPFFLGCGRTCDARSFGLAPAGRVHI
jgi:bifunctional non-homologous end joining protein LigD